MANIGDTVRFLNTTGGGIITRIDGRMAYVTDSDGFDTPVLLNECVVVPSADKKTEAKPTATPAATPAATPVRPSAPVSNNLLLLFEPQDIKRLSQTAFDLYLVNDTPMTLQFAISARDRLESDWTLIAHGLCEPGVQEFLTEVFHTELNRFENIAVQVISFNPDKAFELQEPLNFRTRFDVTRLAKLHSFTRTAYSPADALTLTLNKPAEPKIEVAPTPQQSQKKSLPAQKNRSNEPEVVDLHAHELLDTTAGLQPAEILSYQLDVFDRKMAEASKRPGAKIIFIHGKGEGVLRHAILDRLRRRWPRCEAQDASFREYGFGATQITIHK